MKLKNKVITTVLGVVASSFVFIAAPVSANAGDCSASDPCMTYAEVDSSGNVTNVIVCQPSVCGPNGQFGGTLNGNRLVAQAAANPQTHDTTGVAGQMSNQQENRTVTLSENNVFTVTQNNVVTQKIAVPEIEATPSGSVTTSMSYTTETITVIVKDELNSNPSDGTFPVVPENNTSVDVQINTFNATETTVLNNTSSTINEKLIVNSDATKEEVITIVENSNYVIFKRKLSMLTRLLEERYLV